MFDAVPEFLEVLVECDGLLEYEFFRHFVALDVAFQLVGCEHFEHITMEFLVGFRQGQLEAGLFWIECAVDASVAIHDTTGLERVPDGLGANSSDRLCFLAFQPFEFHEGQHRHLAEGHAAILLVFVLEGLCKILVALIGDDHQLVDVFIEHTLTCLVHGQAEATADLLPFLRGGNRFVQRADLEHIRIVPPFAQRGMAENEPQRLLGGEEAFLVAHDETIDIIIRLRVALGVFKDTLFVLGEIAVVELLHRPWQQALETLVLHQLAVALLKGQSKLARDRASFVVGATVVRDAIDEEEREHLDPPPLELGLLDEMPLDGAADLLAPEVVAHASRLLAERQASPIAQEHKFVAGLRIDLGDLVAVRI